MVLSVVRNALFLCGMYTNDTTNIHTHRCTHRHPFGCACSANSWEPYLLGFYQFDLNTECLVSCNGDKKVIGREMQGGALEVRGREGGMAGVFNTMNKHFPSPYHKPITGLRFIFHVFYCAAVEYYHYQVGRGGAMCIYAIMLFYYLCLCVFLLG